MKRLGVLLMVLALAAACDTSNFAFKVDKSIEILSPKPRTDVPLPVTIAWKDSDPPANPRVDITDPKAEYYAVFVDDAPIKAGKPLSDLLDEDVDCVLADGCPTPEQLADEGVYLTAETSITLEFVPDLRTTSRGNTKDVHDVTIVRMRGDERVGEAAFRQTFFVDR